MSRICFYSNCQLCFRSFSLCHIFFSLKTFHQICLISFFQSRYFRSVSDPFFHSRSFSYVSHPLPLKACQLWPWCFSYILYLFLTEYSRSFSYISDPFSLNIFSLRLRSSSCVSNPFFTQGFLGMSRIRFHSDGFSCVSDPSGMSHILLTHGLLDMFQIILRHFIKWKSFLNRDYFKRYLWAASR